MKYTLRETDKDKRPQLPRYTIEYGNDDDKIVVGYIHNNLDIAIIVMLMNRFQTDGEE